MLIRIIIGIISYSLHLGDVKDSAARWVPIVSTSEDGKCLNHQPRDNRQCSFSDWHAMKGGMQLSVARSTIALLDGLPRLCLGPFHSPVLQTQIRCTFRERKKALFTFEYEGKRGRFERGKKKALFVLPNIWFYPRKKEKKKFANLFPPICWVG